MGLLSGIGNLINNIGSAASQAVVGVANAITTAVGIKYTAPPNYFQEDAGVAGQIYTDVLGGAVVGAGVGAVGAVLTSGASLAVKAVTALATPVVGGALASSPKLANTAVQAVTNLPSSLANYGSNIGTLIESPTLANVKNVVTQDPVLAAATLAGVGLAAGGITSTVSTILNTKATKDNTLATDSADAASGATSDVQPSSSPVSDATTNGQPSNITIYNEIPTATDTTLPTKSTKKKVETKKKKGKTIKITKTSTKYVNQKQTKKSKAKRNK